MIQRSAISVLAILFLIFAGCSTGEEHGELADKVFWKDFENDPEVSEIMTVDTLSTGAWVSPTKAILTDDNHMIVADNGTKTLLKYNLNGELVGRTGGGGRGPGEFELINDLKVDDDSLLYVLDLGLSRVSVFNLHNGFSYQKTITLEMNSDLFLKEIYFTKMGEFGVFIGTTDRRTGDKKHYLYRLNDTFSPDSLLFEYEENEQMELQPGLFAEKFLGERMYWDLAGEYFYVVSSHALYIRRLHINSGKIDEWKLAKSGGRKATDQDRKYLSERYAPLLELGDEYSKAISDVKRLPVIKDFSVQDQRLFFTLFNTNNSQSEVLTTDLDLRNSHLLRNLPPFFATQFKRNNQLYGFDFTHQEDRPFFVLDLEKIE